MHSHFARNFWWENFKYNSHILTIPEHWLMVDGFIINACTHGPTTRFVCMFVYVCVFDIKSTVINQTGKDNGDDNYKTTWEIVKQYNGCCASYLTIYMCVVCVFSVFCHVQFISVSTGIALKYICWHRNAKLLICTQIPRQQTTTVNVSNVSFFTLSSIASNQMPTYSN